MAAERKTRRDILIVRKTFAPETGYSPASRSPVAKEKGGGTRGSEPPARIYFAGEFIRTPSIESRRPGYVAEI